MSILAVILSGGESRRFQVSGEEWVDKALYPVRGKPMISHVLDKASRLASHVVIAVRDPTRGRVYERELGVETVLDDPRLSGPLGGILGALSSVSCSKAIVLPNDMPYIDLRLLENLISLLESHDVVSPILPNGLIVTTIVAVRCETARWVLEELTRYPGRSRVADLHRGAPRIFLVNAMTRGIPPLSLLSINKRELLDKHEASYPAGFLEEDVVIEREFTREDIALGSSRLAGSLWATLISGAYMDEFKLYVESGVLMLAAYTLLDSPSRYARQAGRILIESLKEVS